MRMALKAYDAITDNRRLEEELINEYPNKWIIKTDDSEKHDDLLLDTITQLGEFGVYANEYDITKE
jgi:DNA transposition AAA+ family ATPase